MKKEIKPTQNQRNAVERLASTKGKVSFSKIMRDVGYSDYSANNPKTLTESQGFKLLLKEYGLTDGYITQKLVDDIEAKPGKRFFELNLGAEILGMKKRGEVTQSDNRVLIINVTGEGAKKYGINKLNDGSEHNP